MICKSQYLVGWCFPNPFRDGSSGVGHSISYGYGWKRGSITGHI